MCIRDRDSPGAYPSCSIHVDQPKKISQRVRGRFRTFKLRDLGYAQFRPYLADLEGVDVEQRDGQFYARLAR